jgi:hypothetical protein
VAADGDSMASDENLKARICRIFQRRQVESPHGVGVVGEYSSAELTAGLDVTIESQDGARVFLIEPL